MTSYDLDDRQHATIIAALRFFQGARYHNTLVGSDEHFRDHPPLLSDEVDELIDHLQYEGEDLTAWKEELTAKMNATTDEELAEFFPPPCPTRSCELHVQLLIRIPNHVDDADAADLTIAMDTALVQICDGEGKPIDGATVEEYATMEVFPDIDDNPEND